jgi:hypothetical protein
MRRDKPMTCHPVAAKRSIAALPTNPDAPATRTILCAMLPLPKQRRSHY